MRPLHSNQLPTYKILSFLCNQSLGAHLYALTCMGMIGLPGVAHMPLGGSWPWHGLGGGHGAVNVVSHGLRPQQTCAVLH